MPPTHHDDNGSHGSPPHRLSWSEIAEGFRRILPMTLYVVPMGLAFGAAAVQQDLPGHSPF